MTYVPAYLRPGSQDSDGERLDWTLTSWPRPADEVDHLPSPHRGPLGDLNLARGRLLRAERDADDAERERPARPMVGPALAARLDLCRAPSLGDVVDLD